MAAIAPEGTGWARELKAMARELEAATHGAVHMKWYLGGIAGDEAAALERVRRGQLDGAAGALFCGSLSPTLAVMRVAGLVQSRDEALSPSSTTCGRASTRTSRRTASSALVVGNFGNDIIFLRDRVESFAELRKRPMWMWSAETVLKRQMELMGMHMVPAPIEQLTPMYDGAKIDGMFVIPTAALAFQWTTRAKYFIDLRSSMLAGCIAVSQKSYDQLDFDAAAGADGARRPSSRCASRTWASARTRSCSAACWRSKACASFRHPRGYAAAFIEAAAAARGQLDDKIIPTQLVRESLDLLATYRAAHRRHALELPP